jgi:hypothetical protein
MSELYDSFLSGLETTKKERAENQFNKTDYYKKNGHSKDIYEQMKNGMTSEISYLIKSIKYTINKKTETDKEDD